MMGILVGHMVGDYLVQNDWIASRKASSTWACLLHCLLYTLAMAGALWASGMTWPLWAWGVIFGSHFAFDRFGLARWMMVHVTGQRAFATGPLSPWSIIVVDNTWHLVCAYAVAVVVA
jgi:hypothetical protein